MKNQPLKAAVVGVGYLGNYHAEKYTKSKRAELVAVVDIDESRSRAVAKKYRCHSLTDYQKLKELGVDCVSVATDTTKHFEIASHLLENGIDVLVEKPIANSVAQARQLIEIARANNRILQVGHLERFNPAFTAMESVLTRPWFFEARRIAQFAGRGQDVDVVLDLMIHDIDIIAHLVKQPLEKVEAIGIPVLTKTIDIANARLTFAGGATANVTASRAAFKSERTLRIFQPDLYVSLDYGNKKLKMYKKTGELGNFGLPKVKIDEFSVEERDALADQIESFLVAVFERGVPKVPGEHGLRALEIADRIRLALSESAKRLGEDERIGELLSLAI